MGNTPPLALWNPTGSKHRIIVVDAELGFISGTIGAGTVVWASIAQPSAPTGGSDITAQIVPAIVGSSAVANFLTPAGIKAFQGSTIAGTPAIIKPAFVLEATPIKTQKDEVEGALSLLPGQLLCLQGIAAAGSSPLVLLSVSFLLEKLEET